MILFPNCKINLGLNIVRKRADSFHDLETVFYPLALLDVLEILPSERFGFKLSGLGIPGDEKNNLCVRAATLIKKDYPSLPEMEILLHKCIPVGSGLGGGSSDGAHTLKIINELFAIGLSEDQMLQYALQLGSDCPFFVLNRPCFAKGRGELLEEIPLELSCYSFLIVHTGIHVDTGWAFSKITAKLPGIPLKEIIIQPLSDWKSLLRNDFEEPVMHKFPQLNAVKENLYDKGALYAAMTGSGSSLYGIFKKGALPSISFDENYNTVVIP